MHKSTNGLYVILDVLADSVGPIFEAENDFVAQRSFRSVTEKSHVPGDFRLLKVGYIERDNGQCAIIPEVDVTIVHQVAEVKE